MKCSFCALAGCVFFAALFSGFASAAFPQPQNYLSDFAGVVEPEWAAAINSLGAAVEENSSAQVFVVTVNDTEGSAKDYATRLFNEWGIGTEQKDNGVLIVLAFFPQRRIEIETGYGVEGLLPDSKVGRIRDAYTPLLTGGKYGEGLYRMAEAIGGVIVGSGEFSGGRTLWEDGDLVLFVAIVIIFILLFFGLVAGVGGISSAIQEGREKCPDCKVKMKLAKTGYSGGYIIREFECPACGKKVKKKRYRGHYWVVAGGFGGYGGGGSGGGFGGGGGGSGGGGAGGGF